MLKYILLKQLFSLVLFLNFYFFIEENKWGIINLNCLLNLNFSLVLASFCRMMKSIYTVYAHFLWSSVTISISKHSDFLNATIQHVHAVSSCLLFTAAIFTHGTANTGVVSHPKENEQTLLFQITLTACIIRVLWIFFGMKVPLQSVCKCFVSHLLCQKHDKHSLSN